ncbi:hypothetical protein E5206_09290 [Arthrobacter sp. PAMC25564]|uniref:hypothetical protein n=1 Tax=Arthrobacter sp. PAMC25564 TaxID=2565366 RepID=UPI0010A28FD7|nr:hypothetical protein [Arthrobacter sp. PAMC25564]QCB97098.1 hypothetical protein E5206_09290 [Arthrobacter sp. PAMC25564]
MVKSNREIQAGEHWAYREKNGAPVEEVRIIKLGVKRPSQALLAFLDPEQEALEAWRPIQRLVVPWGELDAFLALEATLYAADAISPNLTNGEVSAIAYVVGAADAESCLDTWVGNSRALMRIRDSRLLSVKLGPDAADVPSHPLAFEDREGLVVPWPVVHWILGGLARRFREECLNCAEDCDEDVKEIRFARSDKRGVIQDPSALKFMRELRDTSESLRRWAAD